jgi:hypothetical protein
MLVSSRTLGSKPSMGVGETIVDIPGGQEERYFQKETKKGLLQCGSIILLP